MPARTGTRTAFRLARIAALVLGSLLFLYACEYSKSALLADRWLEVAGAGLFLAVGIGLAWFEIKVTDFREYIGDEADIPAEPVAARSTHASVRRGASGIRSEYAEDRAERAATRMGHRETRHDDRARTGESVAARIRAAGRKASSLGPESWWKPGRSGAGRDEARSARSETHEFLVESEGWSMRAKLGRSGDLLFHGHDRGGTYPAYEWMWIFHPDTFPAIRDALGDPAGEILDLLEDVVPQLDRHGRHDPGAWLRAHDIPATYREKGVSATQDTREIPLLVPGLPRLVPERRHDPAPHWPQRAPEPPSRRSRNCADEVEEPSTRRSPRNVAEPAPTRAASEGESPVWTARDRSHEPTSAQSGWDSEASARRSHRHAGEPASAREGEPGAWAARDGRYEPTSARSAWEGEDSARRSRGRADGPASARSVWEVEPESVVYEEPRWRARGRSHAESGRAWVQRDEHGYGQDGGEPYEEPQGHTQAAGAWPSYAEPDYQQDAADHYEEPRHAPRPEVPRREPLSARRPPPGAEALGRGPAPVWSERPGRQRNEDSEPWPEQQAQEYRAPSRRRRYVAPPNSTEAPRRSTSYGARPPQP
ncbi:hypothetical protein [Nocardia brasiliensis]|uniref:hypothetical protein n=1 Tax=Nocardia brasiliensis TaxID=37326 RepID=UPI003D91FC3F